MPSVSDFESVAGMGVLGVVNGKRVAVGADRFMTSMGLDASPFAADAARLADEGKTPIYAAVDGALAAILAVADPVKPTSRAAIQDAPRSGPARRDDHGRQRAHRTAIARTLGIDDVYAQVLPSGKATTVITMQQSRRVAFVGDGINDAPALAQADVGIAIGTGTDVAVESADVVLMSGDLAALVSALSISQAALTNIRQNLFWAFAYNVVLIPVAAGVLYPVWGISAVAGLGSGGNGALEPVRAVERAAAQALRSCPIARESRVALEQRVAPALLRCYASA